MPNRADDGGDHDDSSLELSANHPVLQVMQASTRATERLAGRLTLHHRTEEATAQAIARVETHIRDDMLERRRANDLKAEELALRKKELERQDQAANERSSRFKEFWKLVGVQVKALLANPYVTVPLGVVSYGITKIIADWFGVDIPKALP